MKFGDPVLPSRFWGKVQPEPNSGCWLWLGAVCSRGYGAWRAGKLHVKPHRATLSADKGTFLPRSWGWPVTLANIKRARDKAYYQRNKERIKTRAME